MEVRDIAMDFQYGAAFTESSPEAYERLVLDVLVGDRTLFPDAAEVEQSWRVIDPLEEAWTGTKPGTVPGRRVGTAGVRRQVERVLVAERVVQALASDAETLDEIADRRRLVAEVPEDVHRAIQDLVAVELLGTAHGRHHGASGTNSQEPSDGPGREAVSAAACPQRRSVPSARSCSPMRRISASPCRSASSLVCTE